MATDIVTNLRFVPYSSVVGTVQVMQCKPLDRCGLYFALPKHISISPARSEYHVVTDLAAGFGFC